MAAHRLSAPPAIAPAPAADAAGLGPLLALRPELAAGAGLSEYTELAAAQVPPPYRQLLVHEGDMTSTLERHHGAPIDLEPLQWRRVDDELRREVRLVTRGGGRAVEYGAIRIDLGAFDPPARAAILAGRIPLGSILGRHEIAYRSRPFRFFRLRSPTVEAALDLAVPEPLFGRANELTRVRDGASLASVVEILPPTPAAID